MKTQHQHIDTRGTRHLDSWLDQINQVCGHFQARSLRQDFCGSIEAFKRNALEFSYIDARSAHLYRTTKDVSQDNNAHYYAILQISGNASMAQDNHRAQLAPQDMTLVDASRPCDFRFDRMSRQLSLVVPRTVVESTLRHTRIRCTQRVDGQSRLGRLANHLMLDAVQQPDTVTQESDAIMTSLLTLLQPLLTDTAYQAPHESQFNKAIEVIDAYLCNPDLTPALVARKTGISVRNLYRIFSAKQLTVAQYIRTRRLDLSSKRLQHSLPGERLSTLCFSCGFSDTSHFSTAFKRHFGVSPTRYRQLSRH